MATARTKMSPAQKVLATVAVVTFAFAIGLSVHLGYSRPLSPDPATGKTVAYMYHGTTVYVTVRELRALNGCLVVAAVCALATALIEVNKKPVS